MSLTVEAEPTPRTPRRRGKMSKEAGPAQTVRTTTATATPPPGVPVYEIHADLPTCAAAPSSGKSSTVRGATKPRRKASRAALMARIDALQSQEPAFIFADEFDQLTLRDVRLPKDIAELHSEKRTANSVTRMEDVAAGLYDAPLLTAKGEELLFRRMNYLKFRAARQIRSLNAKRSGEKAVAMAERLLREADEARELIILSNVRLVASIAQKFRGSIVKNPELVGEGHIVLMAAVDKFDYSRGFRFSTYATHAVQRHFYRLFQRTQKREQFQTPIGGDMMAEIRADDSQESTHARTAAVATRLLEDAADVLSDREREILDCRFGLGEMQAPETLKVIASRIGLSKERVRQLQVRALEKLHFRAVEMNLPMAFN